MKRVFLVLLLLLGCLRLSAVQAVRGVVTLYQPDGKAIRVRIVGDERKHAVMDLQGHVLVQGPDKYWNYACFMPDGSRRSSGYPAGEPAPQRVLSASFPVNELWADRASAKRLRPSVKAGEEPSADPAPRDRYCLIIPIQFQDKEMGHTRENLDDMVNLHGYSADGATGSVMDYFEDQFRGDCSFHFVVTDIILLDGTSADYFANDEYGKDINAPAAVAEACTKAHELGVDFSGFDADGNGEVDNVFVIAAGKSEASGGDEDCVWPHMSYLRAYSDYKDFQLDGVYINKYNISAELQPADEGPYILSGIGTICHEFSHTLGLMDLYDTDYAGSGGQGSGLWYTTGLMDGGNYNNHEHTPPSYNAIDYDTLGMGNPEQLQVGSYVLEPVDENRRYLRYDTSTEGEYFLIECRRAAGWDKYIGGSGLLIYQIDKTGRRTGNSDYYERDLTALERWRFNEINCRPDHQCARLVSATPDIRAYNASGEFQRNQEQIFYPYKEHDAFTPLTSPAFVFWDGSESPLAITDITLDGDNVRFIVSRMVDVVIPEVTGVDSFIFQDAAIIRWEADNPAYEGPAYVVWGQAGTDGKEVEVNQYAPGKYSVTLEGLSPGKAYKAVLGFRSMGVSSKQVPVNFTTKFLYDDSMPFIYVANLARGEDGSVPAGSELPLRVYNLHDAASVEWEFGGSPVTVSPSGFFTLTRSGVLKAVVRYKSGGTEYISKEINVK